MICNPNVKNHSSHQTHVITRTALKDDTCSNEPKREREEDLDIKTIDHGSTYDLDLTFDQENQIKIEIEYHDLLM